MRLVAFSFVLVVALSLYLYVGADAADITIYFSLSGDESDGKAYTDFIAQLRSDLTQNAPIVYNLPVLPAAAPGTAGFILINLSNYDGINATVAIDMANVYIVGSSDGTNSYFFRDGPIQAYQQLFPGTNKAYLPYNGSYDSLEKAAGALREDIELGLPAFSTEIGNLVYGQPPAKAFIVLVESISEAARFKYNEGQISENVFTTFFPNPKFISLENEWSALSKQIQIAQKYNGLFLRPVQINDVDGSILYVTNVNSTVVKNDIALLLYYNIGVAVGDPTDKPCISSASSCGFEHRKSLGNGRFKGSEDLHTTLNHAWS